MQQKQNWIAKIRNKSIQQIFIILMALASIAPSVKGVFEFGVEQQWWGNGDGVQEQVNYALMKRNIAKTPLAQEAFEVAGDEIILKVYDNGDVMFIRNRKDINQSQMIWSPKDDVEKILESHIFGGVAYADEVSASDIFKRTIPAFKDDFLGWIDSYRVRLKRTYLSGCIKIIIVDSTTGKVLYEEQSNCVDAHFKGEENVKHA